MTRLYVNGEKKEELGPQTIYVMREQDKVNNHYGQEYNAFTPTMYNPREKMHYQRTLVFPLRKAGEFKSNVTNLKVYDSILEEKYIKSF